jgi:hypothetical protein
VGREIFGNYAPFIKVRFLGVMEKKRNNNGMAVGVGAILI